MTDKNEPSDLFNKNKHDINTMCQTLRVHKAILTTEKKLYGQISFSSSRRGTEQKENDVLLKAFAKELQLYLSKQGFSNVTTVLRAKLEVYHGESSPYHSTYRTLHSLDVTVDGNLN